MLKKLDRTIGTVVVLLIKLYRTLVSPIFPRSCRFYPSCSQYALEAVKRHGTLKGLYLAAKRVMKCHPLSKGGYDPVP